MTVLQKLGFAIAFGCVLDLRRGLDRCLVFAFGRDRFWNQRETEEYTG